MKSRRGRKRKAVVKEKVIVKKLRLSLIETVGGTWRKLHGNMFQSGLLDLMGCVEGLHIEIECKRPGELDQVTELQQSRIDEVNANGGLAFATDDIRYGVKTVKRWLKSKVPGA